MAFRRRLAGSRDGSGAADGGQFAGAVHAEAQPHPLDIMPMPELDPDDPHATSVTFNQFKLDTPARQLVVDVCAGHDSLSPPNFAHAGEHGCAAAVWFWTEGGGRPVDRELAEFIGAKFLGDWAGTPAVEEFRARTMLMWRDMCAADTRTGTDVARWAADQLPMAETEFEEPACRLGDGELTVGRFVREGLPHVAAAFTSGRSIRGRFDQFPDPGTGPTVTEIEQRVAAAVDAAARDINASTDATARWVVQETAIISQGAAEWMTGKRMRA